MTPEIITQIKTLAENGKSKKEICSATGLSWYSVYTALTGKRYVNKRDQDYLKISGLSSVHKMELKNIAKNRDRSVNRLLLSYVRAGIALESAQNKIYED